MLSIPAECQNCGRVFIHQRGQSGHTCEVCGGHISCGYSDCDVHEDNLDQQREEHGLELYEEQTDG